MKIDAITAGLILACAAAVYWAVALFAYWVAHPELTQMQVFLSMFDAMLWNW